MVSSQILSRKILILQCGFSVILAYFASWLLMDVSERVARGSQFCCCCIKDLLASFMMRMIIMKTLCVFWTSAHIAILRKLYRTADCIFFEFSYYGLLICRWRQQNGSKVEKTAYSCKCCNKKYILLTNFNIFISQISFYILANRLKLKQPRCRRPVRSGTSS